MNNAIFTGAFVEHCGIQSVDNGEKSVVSTVSLKPHLLNSFGTGHGGLLMTMLDVTLGKAARNSNEDATGIITVELGIHFLAPASGILYCEARVLRSGRTLVFCEGEVRSDAGDIFAKAMGVFKLQFR